MKQAICFLLLSLSLTASAQQDSTKKEVKEVFTIVEQMPAFPGGEDSLVKFIIKNVVYPIIPKEMGISGTSYITFVVGPDGVIRESRVLRGVRPPETIDGKPVEEKDREGLARAAWMLDDEALRVIRMMPVWTPGYQSGRAVSVQYNLPIRFVLR